MEIQYVKPTPVKLADIGKDERWVQERINEDPSILGLGDLIIIQREKPQPTGGRIDFLMYDPDDGVRYEIEVMLGKLNESHIIRTIEYWDIERRRYPSYEHRAVIVAEEITNRFFNIIGLLNKAVPLIALQLNAFRFNSSLALNIVKVLDITEVAEDEDQEVQEQVDRKYWELRSSTKSIEVMDKFIKLLPEEFGIPRITYNRHHVAMGTKGYNFCWIHLRKGPHIHLNMKVGTEVKDEIIKKLEEKGIECNPKGQNDIGLRLTDKELEDNKGLLREVLTESEKTSKR
jgi:hypothetical protein